MQKIFKMKQNWIQNCLAFTIGPILTGNMAEIIGFPNTLELFALLLLVSEKCNKKKLLQWEKIYRPSRLMWTRLMLTFFGFWIFLYVWIIVPYVASRLYWQFFSLLNIYLVPSVDFLTSGRSRIVLWVTHAYAHEHMI